MTEGLVDKVEGNYNALMEENYNVESTANEVLSAPSQEYLDIVNPKSRLAQTKFFCLEQRAFVPLHPVGCLLRGVPGPIVEVRENWKHQ